jgi:hypothetical protein
MIQRHIVLFLDMTTTFKMGKRVFVEAQCLRLRDVGLWHKTFFAFLFMLNILALTVGVLIWFTPSVFWAFSA